MIIDASSSGNTGRRRWTLSNPRHHEVACIDSTYHVGVRLRSVYPSAGTDPDETKERRKRIRKQRQRIAEAERAEFAREAEDIPQQAVVLLGLVAFDRLAENRFPSQNLRTTVREAARLTEILGTAPPQNPVQDRIFHVPDAGKRQRRPVRARRQVLAGMNLEGRGGPASCPHAGLRVGSG